VCSSDLFEKHAGQLQKKSREQFRFESGNGKLEIVARELSI